MINEWRYYNNALIPILPPHSSPKLSENSWGDLFKLGGEEHYLQDGQQILTVHMKQIGGM